jgi:hypothetical protein
MFSVTPALRPVAYQSFDKAELNSQFLGIYDTSITTQSEYGFHSFSNRVEPLTRGLPPPDPRSLCSLSSAEFVEPPPKKLLGMPLTKAVERLNISQRLRA